jgi:hypothetical protein
VATLAITMQVKPKNAEARTVTAEPADMVAFEREFQKSITSLQSNVFLTDLFWLGWHAEKRTGATGLSFDEWVATLETIEAVGGDDMVPLESSPSTG